MNSPNALVVRCEDHRFAEDESNTDHRNHIFIRLVAMRRIFSGEYRMPTSFPALTDFHFLLHPFQQWQTYVRHGPAH